LSLRDRDRLSVLRQVDAKLIPARRGAELLGLSARQLRRLRRRFEKDGDEAVIHGLRGRTPNNAKPAPVRARALERAGEAVFIDFGPTLLAEHLSRDPEIGPLRADTLRRWLIAAGRWEVRRRGRRHRKARPRREAFGELIQWDSSDHAWFEDRYPGRFVLIKMTDDATNRLLMARFVPTDTGAANRQLLIDYLCCYGRPVPFYVDQAGQFGQRSRSIGRIPKEEREAQLTRSIIRCGLESLNVKLILAHSPQAKGRVERDFGTSQDRLVKEMRVAGICSIEEGNRFLGDVYLPHLERAVRRASRAPERCPPAPSQVRRPGAPVCRHRDPYHHGGLHHPLQEPAVADLQGPGPWDPARPAPRGRAAPRRFDTLPLAEPLPRPRPRGQPPEAASTQYRARPLPGQAHTSQVCSSRPRHPQASTLSATARARPPLAEEWSPLDQYPRRDRCSPRL